MQKKYFPNLQIENFWSNKAYAIRKYVGEPLTPELISSIEKELGYKLPASYIELMEIQNGGTPLDDCFPTEKSTSWAKDHIAIEGIYGMDRKKDDSICGRGGGRFMIDHWGYPEIGIYICDCPSGVHDMVALDYRKCGKNGEPEVVHVDQERDYKITFLAKDFETFIKGLVNKKKYDI